MVLPLIGKVSLASFGLGVVAVAAARPLLVTTVRTGYQATDFVSEAWTKAKIEAESVKRDALAERGHDVEAELQQLRSEVASLRAQLGKKAS